jgi:hypothetical protein
MSEKEQAPEKQRIKDNEERRSILKATAIGAGVLGTLALGIKLPASSATSTATLPITWPDPSNSLIFLNWNLTDQLMNVLDNQGDPPEDQTTSTDVLTLNDETGSTLLAITRGGSGMGQLAVGNMALQGDGIPLIRIRPVHLSGASSPNKNVGSWTFSTSTRQVLLGMLHVISISSGTIAVKVMYTDETNTLVTESIASANSKGRFPIIYWLWTIPGSKVTLSVAGPFSAKYDLDVEPLDMF